MMQQLTLDICDERALSRALEQPNDAIDEYAERWAAIAIANRWMNSPNAAQSDALVGATQYYRGTTRLDELYSAWKSARSVPAAATAWSVLRGAVIAASFSNLSVREIAGLSGMDKRSVRKALG